MAHQPAATVYHCGSPPPRTAFASRYRLSPLPAAVARRLYPPTLPVASNRHRRASHSPANVTTHLRPSPLATTFVRRLRPSPSCSAFVHRSRMQPPTTADACRLCPPLLPTNFICRWCLLPLIIFAYHLRSSLPPSECNHRWCLLLPLSSHLSPLCSTVLCNNLN